MRGLAIPDLGTVVLPGGDAAAYAARVEAALPGTGAAVLASSPVEIDIPSEVPVVLIQLGMARDLAGDADGKSNTRAVASMLETAGAFPLLVPPALWEDPSELFDAADHLLMPGGDDIHPALYGESPEWCGFLSLQRDSWDIMMIRMAAWRGVPVTGICRGAQAVAVAFGGSLIRDIRLAGRSEDDHSSGSHPVLLERGSRAESLLGRAAEMPGRHHQEVRDPGRGMRITGRSPDGVAETIEGRGIMCYQFHPESAPESRRALALFEDIAQRRRS